MSRPSKDSSPCPVSILMTVLSGLWTMYILWVLSANEWHLLKEFRSPDSWRIRGSRQSIFAYFSDIHLWVNASGARSSRYFRSIVRTVFREREIETLDKKLPLSVRCRCIVEHPRGSTMDILQALLAKMGHLANRNASFC